MTTPKQARPSSGDGPRIYAWPPLPPHELQVISVTSALKFLPKPFLVGWAAKMSAECAWKDFDVLTLLHEKGDQAAFQNHVKGSRFRDMASKADRGTIVHGAIEAYLDGKPLDRTAVEEKLREAALPQKMWASTFGMISGVLDFLHEAEPEVVWSESTVYSRTHGYAGTADLIARMNVGGSRVPVVIDIKTSKRIYDEVALQLAAYARADFVGLDDGTEVPLLPSAPPVLLESSGQLPEFTPGQVVTVDSPGDIQFFPGTPEKIEYGVVVRPTATGKFEAVTFALTDDVYDTFLAALTLARLDGTAAQARRPS